MNQELKNSLIDISSKVRVASVLTEKIETVLDQLESDQPELELELETKQVVADLSRQIKEIQDSVDKVIEKVC